MDKLKNKDDVFETLLENTLKFTEMYFQNEGFFNDLYRIHVSEDKKTGIMYVSLVYRNFKDLFHLFSYENGDIVFEERTSKEFNKLENTVINFIDRVHSLNQRILDGKVNLEELYNSLDKSNLVQWAKALLRLPIALKSGLSANKNRNNLDININGGIL